MIIVYWQITRILENQWKLFFKRLKAFHAFPIRPDDDESKNAEIKMKIVALTYDSAKILMTMDIMLLPEAARSFQCVKMYVHFYYHYYQSILRKICASFIRPTFQTLFKFCLTYKHPSYQAYR